MSNSIRLSCFPGLLVFPVFVAFSGLSACWFQPSSTASPVAQEGPRIVQGAPQPTATTPPQLAPAPASPVAQQGPRIVPRTVQVVPQPTATTPPQLTPTAPENPNGPVRLVVFNQTGVEVCYLCVVPNNQLSGPNLLADTGPMAVGSEVTLYLPDDIHYWLIRADDCNGRTLHEDHNVEIWGPRSYESLVPMFDRRWVDLSPGRLPPIGRRSGVIAGWYLGASTRDIQHLFDGYCGFIDNDDLKHFCNGDCSFIDNDDIKDLCRGDCSFIDNDDLKDFCRGDCSFIGNDDLKHFCRGDCSFIDNDALEDFCRGH